MDESKIQLIVNSVLKELGEAPVDGSKVTVKVNGETVNEFTEPADADGPGSLGHGTIGLEAVGADSRVQFRNPMIRLLPD